MALSMIPAADMWNRAAVSAECVYNSGQLSVYAASFSRDGDLKDAGHRRDPQLRGYFGLNAS